MKPNPDYEQRARPAGTSTSKREPLPIESSARPGRCQVRVGTDSPCGRPAATEILGVPFCGRCAREQEDYFAIGELTQVPRGRRAVTGNLERGTGMIRPQASAKRRRRSRRSVAKGGKVSFLLVVLVLASALASAACGATGQARGESAATGMAGQERDAGERPRTPGANSRGSEADRAVARAGDAGARAVAAASPADDTKATAGGAKARAGSVTITGNNENDANEGNVEEENGPQMVTLRIGGDPGTEFSGVCSVGRDERAIVGRTPERYAFEPRDRKLECEVRKEGAGALEMVLSDGESVRSVQRTNAGETTVGFAYSDGGISSSTSSVSIGRTAKPSGGSSPEGSP